MSKAKARSKSTKSDSSSEAPPTNRKPDSFRRTRALKRHPGYEPIADEHLPYMWAAYKRGIFKALEQHIPPDLDAANFKKMFLAFLGFALERGEAFVLLVRKNGKDIPGALVTAYINHPYMEPHCFWFPEATPRNRLECALRFLIDAKARYKLVIWAPDPDWTFFEHLCKYGVLRAVGKYRNFTTDGADVILFQGVS